ncbi:MAG: hypothetical protein SXA11_17930 [Cyanobacteriota bacterium]|nr:hypothetical protein [Cyanobacteriota bacterium]
MAKVLIKKPGFAEKPGFWADVSEALRMQHRAYFIKPNLPPTT